MGNPFSRCLKSRPRDPREDPDVIKMRQQEKELCGAIESKKSQLASLRVARQDMRNRTRPDKSAITGYSTQIAILEDEIEEFEKTLKLTRYSLYGTSKQETALATADMKKTATKVLRKEALRTGAVIAKQKRVNEDVLKMIDITRDTRQDMQDAAAELDEEHIVLDPNAEFTDSDDDIKALEKEQEEEEEAYRKVAKRRERLAQLQKNKDRLRMPSRREEEEEAMEEVSLLDNMPPVRTTDMPNSQAAKQTQLQSLLTL
jgi:hypothetical protein